MNRDDIIRMAKQACGSEWSIFKDFEDFMPELERFTALVAAAEREACARVCDEQGCGRNALEHYASLTYWTATAECAAGIRARGE